MNKKLFLLLLVLMSLSLIGIIFVQGYWIKNTVEMKEEQFSSNAQQILQRVSAKLQEKELGNYYFALQEVVDSLGTNPNDRVIGDIFERDEEDDVLINLRLNANGLIEEDYRFSTAFVDAYADTLQLKRLVNSKVTELVEEEDDFSSKTERRERINRILQMKPVEKEFIRSTVMKYTNKIPIHQRVSEDYIESLIVDGMRKWDMNSTFEYGIYGNGLETKVRSDNFKREAPSTYRVSLFNSDEGENKYELYVNFTGKKQEVLSSITVMAALSIIFTLVIVIAYSSSLAQLIKQRQISQIKTDFINNITHEFKTPIATINLALDSIKNPKVSSDPEKVKSYHNMISEENKRMHAQVENVLRISRLEKNELDLNKERLDLHELIDEAIMHVELIVEDTNGYIKTHYGALKTSILGNQSHFCNVIVNLLDNAIKYSEGEPKIDIYTENARNNIVMKIRDQGIGMPRSVQRKIFEKFYREHTGDIHNVKGHGLGLAYVKRIVEDHHGQISVESDKGKGSTFIIKLPLIS